MSHRLIHLVLIMLTTLSCVMAKPASLIGQELTLQRVSKSIDQAKQFLVGQQRPDGSWGIEEKPEQTIVLTSFTLHALLTAGMTPEDNVIQKGLQWIRQQDPVKTHEISLMLETLAEARDGERDIELIKKLVHRLESGQSTGANDGAWTFEGEGIQQNNAHFAALGLFEAAKLGIPVKKETWERAREHWLGRQNRDGGWGNQGSQDSDGGVTAAGIAYIASTQYALQSEHPANVASGDLSCCGEIAEADPTDAGFRWLSKNFSVRSNPSRNSKSDGSVGYFYYMYCLERVGRLTGKRYVLTSNGQRLDWYLEGVKVLIERQNPVTGSWIGAPALLEDSELLATDYALHFLAGGLAPVLMAKYQATSERTTTASRTPNDVWNLSQFASHLPNWPRRVGWMTVTSEELQRESSEQLPVIKIDIETIAKLTDADIDGLKRYTSQGGLLLITGGCKQQGGDKIAQAFVDRLYPGQELKLKNLEAGHPVFYSEFSLANVDTGQRSLDLLGVDTGCRTSILYTPTDLGCSWSHWSPVKAASEENKLVEQAMQLGVNVVAYAAGRNLEQYFQEAKPTESPSNPDRVQRGLLNIAQIRYVGNWNAAPGTLRKLLRAINEASGAHVEAPPEAITLTDKKLYQHPLVYLHGRSTFTLNEAERAALLKHLEQGGVLFADACCSSKEFDDSFRKTLSQLFPDQSLRQISADHELFTKSVGYELKDVRFNSPGKTETHPVPRLEGIELNGKYVVVYCPFDLSCAIENGRQTDCQGYPAVEATQIAVNIVCYTLLH